ncbi:MAG: ankyrin repeat domain-containing protein [Elusimicrobia bacterium]|nr:ankyrin repeat domain-containing protein [Elusimicrobiota bacterium]
MAKKLLDSGARLHSTDNDGFSAMYYANKNKDYSMIELLKSRKKR